MPTSPRSSGVGCVFQGVQGKVAHYVQMGARLSAKNVAAALVFLRLPARILTWVAD